MAISITHAIGVDLINVIPAASVGTLGSGVLKTPHKLGFEVWGDDGKRYVFAQAGASITGATAVCSVSPTTFQATATGGTYLSPAAAMATGDWGWFAAASV